MLAESGFQAPAAIAFLAYVAGVMLLAALSHRLLREKNFLSEYFLGSRGLGLWTLAMTYAATSASGGSFVGFPGLIWAHGWILALWIASYMIVPVCVMGLFGKRLNQVARMSGAITVPDVMRDRFRSPAIGIVAALLLVFFLVVNLVAQFKAGANVIETLIGDLPAFQNIARELAWLPDVFSFSAANRPSPSYCLALLVFAATVIAYTAYGGFRAVVWTDVLQGIVMLFGVIALLVLTLARVDGGLAGATENLRESRVARARIASSEPVELGAHARLEIRDRGERWVFTPRTRHVLAGSMESKWVLLRLEEGTLPDTGFERRELAAKILPLGGDERTSGEEGPNSSHGSIRVLELTYRPDQNLVGVPGISPGSSAGFLPILLALAFFVQWSIAGAGQPTTMVRLMAFRDTRTYRRAMFAVSIYYTLIYLPLVIIFVCARSILPDLDEPDHAMPNLVLTVAPPVLAGIILAAPFAAVMSTVDSFLLAISSSIVRDLFQRTIAPDATAKTIRRLSYVSTLGLGLVVLLGAFNPPRFLQTLVVITGAGFACTYLAPMMLSLYWRRMTAAGTLAGMAGGFAVYVGLQSLVYFGALRAPGPLGVDPLLWGLFASVAGCTLGTFLSPRPDPELVAMYFFAKPK